MTKSGIYESPFLGKKWRQRVVPKMANVPRSKSTEIQRVVPVAIDDAPGNP